MDKKKILFICVHNSARSQIAEAIINNFHSDKFIAESAGFEAGSLNPLVVSSLHDIGIDISEKKTNKVFDFYKEGRMYNYVITVCDEATAERCPVFPGIARRIHWSFPDPSQFTGSDEEKLEQIKILTEGIKHKIDNWSREEESDKKGSRVR